MYIIIFGWFHVSEGSLVFIAAVCLLTSLSPESLVSLSGLCKSDGSSLSLIYLTSVYRPLLLKHLLHNNNSCILSLSKSDHNFKDHLKRKYFNRNIKLFFTVQPEEFYIFWHVFDSFGRGKTTSGRFGFFFRFCFPGP